jgi:preprotein translocase subunit SecY
MFKTIANAFKVKEIRVKILITLALLLVYRIGAWLPVPGINIAEFGKIVGEQDFLNLLSSVSGGALANGAILALGIAPYISASIIIQLLTIAIPSLEKLTKMGDEGQKKIAFYNKIVALILAVVQAVGIVIAYKDTLNSSLFGYQVDVWVVAALVATILIAGSMFTYWLGEKITELGISNGLSLLIFVGILSTAGTSLLATFTSIFNGNVNNIWEVVIFAVALILIFGFIVFIDTAERKVPVQYAKQIKGRKMYGGQSTHIPIRVNSTGVMPIIFSMSILTFPQLLMSFFWPESSFYKSYSQWLGAGSWVYIVLVGLLILFFSYFWSQVTFNPDDISRNIQQNGGFIPGIRPGKPTAEYLKKISNRITLFGALFLSVIAIIPSLVFKGISSSGGLVNAFSATGLLIVVSVALEIDKQLDSQMLMRNYKGFLK